MGVYINMEMPTSFYKCPIKRRDGMDLVCHITHERFSVADVNILEHRLDNCPLDYVPPHGRLIDADALLRDRKSAFVDRDGYPEFSYTAVIEAPTVIPAGGGEKA